MSRYPLSTPRRPFLHAIRTSSLAAAFLLAAFAASAQAPRSPTPDPQPLPAKVVVVAQGLEHPWGLVLLPDGGMLVTERPGRLRRIGKDGQVSGPLAGVPICWFRSGAMTHTWTVCEALWPVSLILAVFVYDVQAPVPADLDLVSA